MGWAKFWAVDLHVHTPASEDASDGDFGNPKDVVRAARAAGLDCIAVTDHNTAGWCDAMTDAAEGESLVVLPGVEISTTEGHLLGIWEEGTASSVIEDVLVRIGISRADFGRLDVTSHQGLLETAEEIQKASGIAIPAHIDKERGLLGLAVRNHANALLASPVFAALEFVSQATPEVVKQRSSGKSTTAFIQNSDAYDASLNRHASSGIGVRRTWIKAARPDLIGLKHALNDPSLRVALSEARTQSDHARITAASVSQGFLKDINLTFSPDMNCLLGGTGSGKSLSLEVIRFALNQQVDADAFPQIRDEVDNRLRVALGPDSEVTVDFEISGERHRVQRRYSVIPGAPVVFKDVNGNWFETDVPVTQVLKVAAFSQGEVLEYARQPVGRMALIDAELDLADLGLESARIKGELHINGEALIRLRAREYQLVESAADEKQLTERIAQLSDLFESDMVTLQAEWTKDKAAVTKLLAEIPSGPSSTEITFRVPDAKVIKANAARFERIRAAVADFAGVQDNARQLQENGLLELKKVLEQSQDDIGVEFDTFTDEFDALLSEKSGTSVKLLRSELETAQTKLGHSQAASEELREEVRPHITRTMFDREQLLNELKTVRGAIRAMRRSRIDVLNRKTAGHVKLDIPTSGDTAAYREKLEALKVGSRVRESVLDSLAKSVHPFALARSILGGDATLGGQLPEGVAATDVARLITNIDDRSSWDELLSLQIVDTPDILRIKFRKPEGQAYAGIEDLSHGQKCTAILVVLLADGDNPVLVDQPEDALHAPWIEDYLVERLRSLRGHRQYVFATRSPGLVVSADAEQIITLRATAQAGELEASGSLERHDLNKLALHHLEGGRPPFERRAKKLIPSMS